MEERKLTHLVGYGDREHFANLAYLTGFDPRFEESVLIVGPNSKPLLVVGNECESYVGVSPLFNDGKLKRTLSVLLLAEPAARSEPEDKANICRRRNRCILDGRMRRMEVFL
jgi:hypothetical protein